MDLTITVRADVLAAITHDLYGGESLGDVIEDLSYWEAAARKRFAGSSEDTSSPIDPTTTSPTTTISVPISDAPVRMLRESMRPGETLDGLVTALLIAEVRHRRTGMHWPVYGANEPVMTDDATTVQRLIVHHETAITTTGGHLMYTITTEVRDDVLTAFDASLDDWEDRNGEIAALIHLEDECRDAQWSMVCDDISSAQAGATTTIDVTLDAHDYATLERLLGTGEDAGQLLTGLMLSALSGHRQGAVRASDPLPMPA
ncbi:hypothetical protein BI49514_00292 [Brevibacterium iodinum ATCC 49514]|uniref:Uncharacterized protein n=1 Tax=Brevibacterium iodinum ATCC 49514 TaxID=1255616 RepID=A0A2H1HUJ7_9MICO|nr:hypothetical protein [Brevibacterium iodinum]SMX66530.1 hypothetical protein BI49514_00292 [Brevibacterium iodinum ATCC 49514]SUW13576.1 Uncharacterised protein [Brevibacterium iodinum]